METAGGVRTTGRMNVSLAETKRGGELGRRREGVDRMVTNRRKMNRNGRETGGTVWLTMGSSDRRTWVPTATEGLVGCRRQWRWFRGPGLTKEPKETEWKRTRNGRSGRDDGGRRRSSGLSPDDDVELRRGA